MVGLERRGVGRAARWLGVAVLSLACGGCVVGREQRKYWAIQTGLAFPQEDLIVQTLESTREGSDGVNSLHEWDIARDVAYGGLGQLEGMYKLEPDDENGLYMLNRAWAATSFAFILDEHEIAVEAGDEPAQAYQAARARAGFKRARFFGERLLEQRTDGGFKGAQKNVDTMRAWLEKNYDDPAHVDELIWLGYAWIGRVSVDADNPAAVAELWVGVSLLEHAVRLDESAQDGTAHVVLGAYHARTGMAELEEAKQHFDRAIELSHGKVLTAQLNLAQRYYCLTGKKAEYVKTLQSVLDEKDPLPTQRLANAISKRRAFRYLHNPVWQEDCGFKL